jgi:hypothetical protein
MDATARAEWPPLTRQALLRRASVATAVVAAGGMLAPRAAADAAGDDIVKVQGRFTLAGGSDGIDPTTQPVALRLLVPPGDPVYPAGVDFMPFTGFVATPDGWSLSSAEKARTGVQAFDILRTERPDVFAFTFVDTRTPLPAGDYGAVWLRLTVGGDGGQAAAALVDRGGLWALA